MGIGNKIRRWKVIHTVHACKLAVNAWNRTSTSKERKRKRQIGTADLSLERRRFVI